jgi:hypothetical protein
MKGIRSKEIPHLGEFRFFSEIFRTEISQALQNVNPFVTCNSEQSEESSLSKYLDPSRSLRVTEKIGFDMARRI